MQFQIVVAVLALATSMVAAMPYDAPTTLYYARNGQLKCHKYNYQLICDTTHHCVGGKATHKPGTYGGNAVPCEDHRSCWCE